MTRSTEQQTIEAFCDALESEGLEVDSTMQQGPGLSLMYAADGSEIGTVARVYADHRAVTPFLSVTLLTSTGRDAKRVANYHIEQQWAESYAVGSLDSEEYAKRVASTYTEPAHFQGEL